MFERMVTFVKQCVLHPEKKCNDCGECDDRCMLDPNKICDNCFQCLDGDKRAFAEIPISGVFFEEEYSPERENLLTMDPEDGYVLDSDGSWKEGLCLHVRTLRGAYASRAKRRRVYR